LSLSVAVRLEIMHAISSFVKSPTLLKSFHSVYLKTVRPQSFRIIFLPQRSYTTEIKTFHLAGIYTSPEYSKETQKHIGNYFAESVLTLKSIQESLNTLQNNDLPAAERANEISKVKKQMRRSDTTISSILRTPFKWSFRRNTVSATLRSFVFWPVLGIPFAFAIQSTIVPIVWLVTYGFFFWNDLRFVFPIIKRLVANQTAGERKVNKMELNDLEMEVLFVKLRLNLQTGEGGNNKEIIEELLRRQKELEEDYSELLTIMQAVEKESNEEGKGFIKP
jgi:hypothetical protein